MLPGWNQIRQQRLPPQSQNHNEQQWMQQGNYQQQHTAAGMHMQGGLANVMHGNEYGQQDMQDHRMMAHTGRNAPGMMNQQAQMYQQQQQFMSQHQQAVWDPQQHHMTSPYRMNQQQTLMHQPPEAPPPKQPPPPAPVPPPPPPSDEKPPMPKPPPPEEEKWWDQELNRLNSVDKGKLERLTKESWFLSLSKEQQVECWHHKLQLVSKQHKQDTVQTQAKLANSGKATIKAEPQLLATRALTPQNEPGGMPKEIKMEAPDEWNLDNKEDPSLSLAKYQQQLLKLTRQDEQFEKQYNDWHKQFDEWKQKHQNHPNQAQFSEYEKQWVTWQEQMMKQKAQNRQNIDRLQSNIRRIQQHLGQAKNQQTQHQQHSNIQTNHSPQQNQMQPGQPRPQFNIRNQPRHPQLDQDHFQNQQDVKNNFSGHGQGRPQFQHKSQTHDPAELAQNSDRQRYAEQGPPPQRFPGLHGQQQRFQAPQQPGPQFQGSPEPQHQPQSSQDFAEDEFFGGGEGFSVGQQSTRPRFSTATQSSRGRMPFRPRAPSQRFRAPRTESNDLESKGFKDFNQHHRAPRPRLKAPTPRAHHHKERPQIPGHHEKIQMMGDVCVYEEEDNFVVEEDMRDSARAFPKGTPPNEPYHLRPVSPVRHHPVPRRGSSSSLERERSIDRGLRAEPSPPEKEGKGGLSDILQNNPLFKGDNLKRLQEHLQVIKKQNSSSEQVQNDQKPSSVNQEAVMEKAKTLSSLDLKNILSAVQTVKQKSSGDDGTPGASVSNEPSSSTNSTAQSKDPKSVDKEAIEAALLKRLGLDPSLLAVAKGTPDKISTGDPILDLLGIDSLQDYAGIKEDILLQEYLKHDPQLEKELLLRALHERELLEEAQRLDPLYGQTLEMQKISDERRALGISGLTFGPPGPPMGFFGRPPFPPRPLGPPGIGPRGPIRPPGPLGPPRPMGPPPPMLGPIGPPMGPMQPPRMPMRPPIGPLGPMVPPGPWNMLGPRPFFLRPPPPEKVENKEDGKMLEGKESGKEKTPTQRRNSDEGAQRPSSPQRSRSREGSPREPCQDSIERGRQAVHNDLEKLKYKQEMLDRERFEKEKEERSEQRDRSLERLRAIEDDLRRREQILLQREHELLRPRRFSPEPRRYRDREGNFPPRSPEEDEFMMNRRRRSRSPGPRDMQRMPPDMRRPHPDFDPNDRRSPGRGRRDYSPKRAPRFPDDRPPPAGFRPHERHPGERYDREPRPHHDDRFPPRDEIRGPRGDPQFRDDARRPRDDVQVPRDRSRGPHDDDRYRFRDDRRAPHPDDERFHPRDDNDHGRSRERELRSRRPASPLSRIQTHDRRQVEFDRRGRDLARDRFPSPGRDSVSPPRRIERSSPPRRVERRSPPRKMRRSRSRSRSPPPRGLRERLGRDVFAGKNGKDQFGRDVGFREGSSLGRSPRIEGGPPLRRDAHQAIQQNRRSPAQSSSGRGTPTSVDPPPPRVAREMPEGVRRPLLAPAYVKINDLIDMPGRMRRPAKIVVILRGLPGSGKTHIAKLIRDKETDFGVKPRVLSMDNYFMSEVEKTEKDPDTGKKVVKKVLEYEYEPEMEKSYRDNLLRSFRKTLEDGYFSFVIVDAVNQKVTHFSEFYEFAKNMGFETYVAEIKCDPHTCSRRNIHKRTLAEIQDIASSWEDTVIHMNRLDLRLMVQDSEIQEVEMDDASDEESKSKDAVSESSSKDAAPTSKEEEDSLKTDLQKSKWESDSTAARLDKLDGIAKKAVKRSMEDFLSLPDDYDSRQSAPGKKRVRWADIHERKNQQRMRDVGFVVGQTDWSRMMDDSHATRALNRTKFI